MDPFYIGLADFKNFNEVTRILKVFRANRPPSLNCQIHVGAMMSRKTLLGLPSKSAAVFPPKEEMADIFAGDDVVPDDVMNCLHYADLSDRANDDLHALLYHAINYCGLGITAIQLDMTWPEAAEIGNAVHASRKQLEVILQIGDKAFEIAHNDPLEMVRRLEDYQGVIQRVLLDRSMGRGIGLKAEKMFPFLTAIQRHLPDLKLGVAGGLGPDTMHLVEPLLEVFPDLSIDAQAQLHPDGDPMKPIDWDRAEAYVIKALKQRSQDPV